MMTLLVVVAVLNLTLTILLIRVLAAIGGGILDARER
jgi:hypothetical protein